MHIVVVFSAPIPVGHRVRVTWFQLIEPGLAGQTRTDSRPHQPTLVDLDTGIRYETDWRTGAHRRRYPDMPYELGEDSLEQIEVEQQIEGVVRGCRVVTVRGYPELELQTHLDIEPD